MTVVFALASWLALYGCTNACAAGISANLYVESRGYPCIESSSGAIGLQQLVGPRRRRYHQYAAYIGHHWCDTNAQIGFLMTELGEMGLRNWMLRARDPGQVAAVFDREYERPGVDDTGRRANIARRFYAMLSRRY